MKKILILAFSLFTLGTYAQREVPQSRMEQIYEEAKTPYKYGLAVAPADNKHKIDCPTVFPEGDKWYMTYVAVSYTHLFGGTVFVNSGVFGGSGTAAVGRVGN